MWTSTLWLACVSLLFGTSLSCYRCFIDNADSGRLCWGHILDKVGVRNVDACFRKLDRIFNNNKEVIEAGSVGAGYDKQLGEILNAEILPIVRDFDKNRNTESVYEERLKMAANNFIAAASKLPRVSGCFPPCGFQIKGASYNCITCKYDSCQFPLDCPVKEINVTENSKTRIQCDVPFALPHDIEVIWRFAEEKLTLGMVFEQNNNIKLKTQQVDTFKEVIAGVDTLYSIPSTGLHHRGTYQCEIFSGQNSIVRLYFYLTVIPQIVVGHTELQKLFDLSLLPGGHLLPGPAEIPHSPLLSTLLLTTCLTAVLLLLFLSLGAVILSSVLEKTNHTEYEDQDL